MCVLTLEISSLQSPVHLDKGKTQGFVMELVLETNLVHRTSLRVALARNLCKALEVSQSSCYAATSLILQYHTRLKGRANLVCHHVFLC